MKTFLNILLITFIITIGFTACGNQTDIQGNLNSLDFGTSEKKQMSDSSKLDGTTTEQEDDEQPQETNTSSSTLAEIKADLLEQKTESEIDMADDTMTDNKDEALTEDDKKDPVDNDIKENNELDDETKPSDTTAPVIELATFSELSTDNDPSFSFMISDEDTGSGVNISSLSLSIDDVHFSISDEELSVEGENGDTNIRATFRSLPLNDGDYELTINASDMANNTADPVVETFTIVSDENNLNEENTNNETEEQNENTTEENNNDTDQTNNEDSQMNDENEIATSIEENIPFIDIAEHPYEEAIVKLWQKGLFQDQLQFRPDSPITRGELVATFARSRFTEAEMSDCLNTTEISFPDYSLEADIPFAGAVCVMAENNYISGFAEQENILQIYQKITGAEALKLIGFFTEDEFQNTDPWFIGVVEYYTDRNALPSDLGKIFDKNITRAQVAEIICRIMDNINDRPSKTFEEVLPEFVEG